MSNENLYSVTVEEAVALLINLDHVPAGKSVLDVVAADLQNAETRFDSATEVIHKGKDWDPATTAGSIFEALFIRTREEVAHSRSALAQSLFAAFASEMGRPERSQLVQVPHSSAVPRFTVESVNRWAIQNFGLCIPGLVKAKKERLFYQAPNPSHEEEEEPAASAPDTAEDVSTADRVGNKKVADGLGKVAANNLYVTMAFLTEMFINKRTKWLLPDGTINISQTAETIAEHIAKDPVAKDVGGQGIEAIKNRLEAAQEAKRVKVNRL